MKKIMLMIILSILEYVGIRIIIAYPKGLLFILPVVVIAIGLIILIIKGINKVIDDMDVVSDPDAEIRHKRKEKHLKNEIRAARKKAKQFHR